MREKQDYQILLYFKKNKNNHYISLIFVEKNIKINKWK